jgi:malate dehydrogenase (oxaloacetate-decarboxylating)
MTTPPYELVPEPVAPGADQCRGSAVLASPAINRGTAFSLEERQALGLDGLLPSGVTTLEVQVRRVYAQYLEQANPLRKWVYLANLRDRNEVLFYRMLTEHISEMLPVYAHGGLPSTVQSRVRRPRGVTCPLIDLRRRVGLAQHRSGTDDVDLLVATDSEGILGIGRTRLKPNHVHCGRWIHPRLRCQSLIWAPTISHCSTTRCNCVRHSRVRDQRYDDLIDAYVSAVTKLFPNAMLHWEDFGATNARRILIKYSDQVCTFNDDMQGTAATVLAAAFSAVRAAGSRIRDQRVVIYGAGTAGLGIADMMREQ